MLLLGAASAEGQAAEGMMWHEGGWVGGWTLRYAHMAMGKHSQRHSTTAVSRVIRTDRLPPGVGRRKHTHGLMRQSVTVLQL